MASSKLIPSTAVQSPIREPNNTLCTNWCYTHEEDIANTITHAFGIVLSVIGLWHLWMVAGQFYAALVLGVYGITSVMVYSTSTAYHYVRNLALKKRLQVFDHCAIYLLIAGSYTPYLTLGVQSAWGTAVLFVVWGIALIAVAYRLFATDQRLYEKYSLVSYVGLGWAVLLVLPQMLATIPAKGLVWLAAGGVFYMLGIIFYRWDHLRFNHAIWHLFVLAGSVSHFLSITTLLPVS